MASLPDFAHQRIERRPARGGHAEPGRAGSASGASSPPSSKHNQILRGAREVFLASGFDGASMGEIARAAGVSKGTLYVYFDSKEDLFTALVTDECTRTAEACFDLDPDGPSEETLQGLASRYIHAMLEPSHLRTVRMVIGVAEKLPEIGRAFLQAGHVEGVRRLSKWLQVKIAQGEFVIEDVELAAWQFMLGCQSKIIVPMIFGDNARPDATIIGNVVDQTVRSFMSAFASKKQAANGTAHGAAAAETPDPSPASAD
ncbi:transcriptional regulator, TetR family [Ancylobacter rudongensis]|uniref:Transcriptional regulator, TetR family n=2 Tax=Ancylobacter rudongensis TaxID=177413 RepID=A0A1G4SMU2_9HYPH|nr:transcriptional regulator, TetR family [Ancylobacter rudongensis]